MSSSARYTHDRTQPRRAWLLLPLLSFFSLVFANNSTDPQQKTCYLPDGAPSNFPPCVPKSQNSICCGFGFSCLSNGLCETGPSNQNVFKSQYYRPTCTDKTWTTPSCPHICISSDDNLQAGQGVRLCNIETQIYCCERDYDCCRNSSLVFQLGTPHVVTTVPRPTRPTITPAAGGGDGDGGETQVQSTKQTIFGIAIGFAISALFFITTGIFFLLRQRKRRQRRNAEVLAENVETAEPKELDAVETSQSTVSPTDSHETWGESSSPIELDTLPSRVELEDTMTLSPVTPITPGGKQASQLFELEAPFKLDSKPGER